MGYWASGGGGGYEEHECYLIRIMDNETDEGYDDISSRDFGMGKATPSAVMYGLERYLGMSWEMIRKKREEKVALDYAHALGNDLTQRLSFIMFLLHQAHKPFLFYVRFDVRYHEA